MERDRVIRRFEIPDTIVASGVGMASITVDADERNCENTFAYVPDLANSRIYVYRLVTTSSTRNQSCLSYFRLFEACDKIGCGHFITIISILIHTMAILM